MTDWLQKIDYCLDHCERPSQDRFLRSVRSQIELCPELFPTTSQACVVARLYRHFQRVAMRECLGGSLDCLAV